MRILLVLLLGSLLGAAVPHLHEFVNVCGKNDVKVECIPACPRVCMNVLIDRRCRPIKCTPGCACREGWVRKDSVTGKCIQRSACKRWIL